MRATQITTARLRWHAGLDGDSHADPNASGRSLDRVLAEPEPDPQALTAALEDLLDVIESLNVEINGDPPSESINADAADVPRAIAYAVSEITSRLRSNGNSDAVRIVDTAWNAVLAGDIDNIRAHVVLERNARR